MQKISEVQKADDEAITIDFIMMWLGLLIRVGVVVAVVWLSVWAVKAQPAQATTTVPVQNSCAVDTRKMAKNLKKFYSNQCKLERIRRQIREFKRSLANPVVVFVQVE